MLYRSETKFWGEKRGETEKEEEEEIKKEKRTTNN